MQATISDVYFLLLESAVLIKSKTTIEYFLLGNLDKHK
jgi:hypothetical protein